MNDGHGHAHCHASHPAAHAAQAAPAPTPEGAVYTCPMHPQIRQASPGHCPICGMALEPVLPALQEEGNPELDDFQRRFWWTLPLSICVAVLAMAGHRMFPGGLPRQSWMELLLASPVVLWAGAPFLVRALRSVRDRHPNMWTLIGLGATVATTL
jgi:Cu+-exporting ATPase